MSFWPLETLIPAGSSTRELNRTTEIVIGQLTLMGGRPGARDISGGPGGMITNKGGWRGVGGVRSGEARRLRGRRGRDEEGEGEEDGQRRGRGRERKKRREPGGCNRLDYITRCAVGTPKVRCVVKLKTRLFDAASRIPRQKNRQTN